MSLTQIAPALFLKRSMRENRRRMTLCEGNVRREGQDKNVHAKPPCLVGAQPAERRPESVRLYGLRDSASRAGIDVARTLASSS